MAAEVMAKGVNFVYFKKYVVEKHGETFWNKMLERLDPGERDLLETAVISGWYPFTAFKKVFFLYADLMGEKGKADLPKVYEYIADQSLNTLYKLFFKVAQSPQFVLNNYPKLWSLFFNQGQVEILDTGDHQCTFRFIIPEIFLDWLPPACEGYTRKAVMLSGGGDVVVRELSRSREGVLHVVTYSARWR